LQALVGGALIGAAATWYWVANGRVAGISGIVRPRRLWGQPPVAPIGGRGAHVHGRRRGDRGRGGAADWRQPVDRRAILGSAIFGVGWGLAGYCPGPAIVSAGSGVLSAAVFVLAMVAGIAAAGRSRNRTAPTTQADPLGCAR
jgi:uncharacterized membrane protein YedE/YeeE